ncbi:MAG: hypothetical protein DRJ60_05275 [Thermoprotei archaeon]|nr:MAG: hypothetical protein DRJ60_05275 [Thermoprotei archaeon]
MNEMSTDEAVKMIEGLAEIKAEHFSITGGEPTLRDDLPKLIIEAQDRGLEVSIVTNTILLTEDFMEFLAKRDVEIQVSIDGVTKETFAKIRGPFLDMLLDKVRKLKRLGARLRPIMTINTINYREAGDYVRLCAEIETMSAALIPVIPVGRANRSLMPTPSMVKEALFSAAQAAEETGFNIEFWCSPFAHSFINSSMVTICPCMINSCLDIAPDGSIMLCDTLDIKVTTVKIGVPKAWKDYLSNELVRSLSTPLGLKASCRTCKYASICLGGCHARAKTIYGDLKMPDPLCPLASRTEEELLQLRQGC